MLNLELVAITHHNTPISILERISLDRPTAQALATELVTAPGTSEAVVVSTCNRTEIYLAGARPDAAHALRCLSRGRVPIEVIRPFVRFLSDHAMALHLIQVAAGLDSRIVGEGEILGQIRSAIAAAANDTAGPELTSLFRFAIAAGRRARHANDVVGVPSLARIALDTGVLDGVDVTTTLVLGAGAMAAAAARELNARGRPYRVWSRRPERAARIVRHSNDIVATDDLADALDTADLVICATGARLPILTAADLYATIERRNGRSLVVIDLSMPRNVDPSAATLTGIQLFDLEALRSDRTELDLRRRNQIVDDEYRRYRLWLAGRSGSDLIAALRDHVHQTCRDVVASRSPDAAPAQIALIARTMANRLLHAPTVQLKEHLAAVDIDRALAVLDDHGVDTHTFRPVPTLTHSPVAMCSAS